MQGHRAIGAILACFGVFAILLNIVVAPPIIKALGGRNTAIFGACLQAWGILFPLFPATSNILTLPILEWRGALALVFAAVLVIEIVLTMWDFVIEMVVRKPLGDVYAGERVTHNFMGIIYGAMIAFLIPVLWGWWSQPTGFAPATHGAPILLIGSSTSRS